MTVGCAIEKCSGQTFAKGMCYTHYYRLYKHGSPFAGRVSPGELKRFLEEVAIGYQGSDCLNWPYGKYPSGYGKIRVNGKGATASRLVCERTHGVPPSDSHEAAHSCGNRACVNPSHLRWATQAENEADKLIHGTDNRGERHPLSKVTTDIAKQVISLRGKETGRATAKRFGLSNATVSGIQTGRSWAHLHRQPSKAISSAEEKQGEAS